MSADTQERNDTKPSKPLPGWKVIVHDDDHNTYEHVIKSLMAIIRLNLRTAYKKTVEVDKQGLAVVEVTHKEKAELLRDQLQSLGLTSTIEADE